MRRRSYNSASQRLFKTLVDYMALHQMPHKSAQEPESKGARLKQEGLPEGSPTLTGHVGEREERPIKDMISIDPIRVNHKGEKKWYSL